MTLPPCSPAAVAPHVTRRAPSFVRKTLFAAGLASSACSAIGQDTSSTGQTDTPQVAGAKEVAGVGHGVDRLDLKKQKSTPADTAPWILLFNGTDFTGWKIVALDHPAPAMVEAGAMVLRQRANTVEHTFVTSERKYRDFILELELKDDPGFNSGILLRCADAPPDAKVRLNGYQVKIDNMPRAWTGGVFDDFGAGWKWLFDLNDDPRARAAFKLGEWAHFRIECLGPTIKVWVNGVPTCHLVDEKYREGYLAFKIHSLGNKPDATDSAIRLKNIRIITEHPERYQQPMALPSRRAPSTPGSSDRALPQREAARPTATPERARLLV